MPRKLGILAGAGDLPARLATACVATGREVFVVAFEDHAAYGGIPHARSTLTTVGRTLDLLHRSRCEEVVLAGGVARPALKSLKPDRRGAALLAKILAKGGGDDAALSAIVSELETEGFTVVGADEVLADLLTPLGTFGRVAPGEDDRRDIDRGVRVVRALETQEVGQAVVVAGGVVLGVEDQAGTDALMRRCEGSRGEGRGGVLVKMRRPDQDRRVDLPTIGAATVEIAARTGLNGIAVEAGGSLVVDRAAVVELADRTGLFVIGVTPPRD